MSKFRNVSGEEKFTAFGTSPGAVAPDGVIDVVKEADENYDCQPEMWERVVDAKPVKNSEENK